MSGNNWRTSTYSGGQGGECVEVGQGNCVLVRDTKDNGTGPILRFTSAAWKQLTQELR